MAYTGPGSYEWIEEQYRKAREAELRRQQARAGGQNPVWGPPRSTSTGSIAPTTPNSPNSGGPTGNRNTGPTAAQLRAQAQADQRAAETRAEARAAELRRKTGQRYLKQAENLEAQAKALQHALRVSFKQNLDQNLRDVGEMLDSQLGQLKTNYADRLSSFREVEADTEQAAEQHSASTFENLVRERQDTMTGMLSQGAGETDAMRAMVIAARNWRDNESEGNRAYFDSMRGVRSGIVDLASDTRSAMMNAQRAGEAERERLWQNFYDRRSESFTQLGNLRQQQADYYASAEEMEVKPPVALSTRRNEAATNFMNAAKEAGKSYVQKGVPDWITGYGQADMDQKNARRANTDLAAAVRFEPIQQAEGATLRRWA